MIDETLFEAEEKMEKAVHVARDELGGLRTGRASPNSFARMVVDYYGSPTPIPQMASVNIPEARMAVIKPYDASQLGAIERVIRDSDLGVNPTQRRNDHPRSLPAADRGASARTGQGRPPQGRGRQGVDPLGATAREGRTGQDGQDGEVGEDDVHRAEAELEKITGRYTAQVDEVVRAKEAELLEV